MLRWISYGDQERAARHICTPGVVGIHRRGWQVQPLVTKLLDTTSMRSQPCIDINCTIRSRLNERRFISGLKEVGTIVVGVEEFTRVDPRSRRMGSPPCRGGVRRHVSRN